MRYSKLYPLLREKYSLEYDSLFIEELELKITNHDFMSDITGLYPEGDEYSEINPLVKALIKYYLAQNEFSDRYLLKSLSVPDSEIEENNKFKYSILSDSKKEVSSSAIILLHGLNERGWEKYLTWAYFLLKHTGKPVILFPNAFHMNRAPKSWSNFRLMNEISNERKNLLPGVVLSSPVNVAISTRLQFVPQRFVYSGIQTIRDIISLAGDIKEGNVRGLAKGTSVDFFGYSIGAFISEIIMMSNPFGVFNNSKCFLFCGGTTLNKMSPVNKYILDSEAANTIQDFYVHKFEQNLAIDERLRSLFGSESEEAFLFKAMLGHDENLPVRKRYLAKIRDRVFAMGLAKDTVIPADSIREALISDHPKKIRFELADPPYNYTHENPFPLLTKIENEVERQFENIFTKAANFLN
ncbi:hypothetical protein MASR1M107_08360 [Ignavibacteriales bacterium]